MIYLSDCQKYLVPRESITPGAQVIADNPLFYPPSAYEVMACQSLTNVVSSLTSVTHSGVSMLRKAIVSRTPVIECSKEPLNLRIQGSIYIFRPTKM